MQEMQQREDSLSAALLEARASLSNMQRLHQASQNQLFTMQSQTEEQQVGQALPSAIQTPISEHQTTVLESVAYC